MSRQVVYIAGPIRKGSLLHNVRQADAAMGELMRRGYSPINPMLSVYAGCSTDDQNTLATHGVWAPADPQAKLVGVTAQDWLDMDLAIVERCDVVLRLPGESVGADGEVAHATKLGIPVFYSIDELDDAMTFYFAPNPNASPEESQS